jgi:hypothetical protein
MGNNVKYSLCSGTEENIETVEKKFLDDMIKTGIAVDNTGSFNCPKCNSWNTSVLKVTKSEFVIREFCDPGYTWLELQKCNYPQCGCLFVIKNGYCLFTIKNRY